MSIDPFRIGGTNASSSLLGAGPSQAAASPTPPQAAQEASPVASSDHVSFSGEAHEVEQGSGLTGSLASTWGDPASSGFAQTPAPAAGFSSVSNFCSHGGNSSEPGFQSASTFATPLLNS